MGSHCAKHANTRGASGNLMPRTEQNRGKSYHGLKQDIDLTMMDLPLIMLC